MAYVAGTANSITDLLTALQNACTANGWTLSGNVLHRGNCFVACSVVAPNLIVRGGTGIDGSNALTGACPQYHSLGVLWSGETFAFPMTYEVHIHEAPDEVYLIVNYAVDTYQWLAFGCSPAPGLAATGNWFGASRISNNTSYINKIMISPSSHMGIPASISCGLFWNNGLYDNACGRLQHGEDGYSWSVGETSGECSAKLYVDAIGSALPLSTQPNAWNGESILVPIQPVWIRPSNKVSQVGAIGHARYLRIDSYAPGDVITLGPDRWKVYPWYRKNAAARDGGSYIDHTGTMGWAIRYDGP